MPVVARGDINGVDVFSFEQFANIDICINLFVSVLKLFAVPFEMIFVDIAQGCNTHTGNVAEFRYHEAAFAPYAFERLAVLDSVSRSPPRPIIATRMASLEPTIRDNGRDRHSSRNARSGSGNQ